MWTRSFSSSSKSQAAAGFCAAAAAAFATMVTATAAPAPKEPALDLVLARAGAYVAEFQRQFSGIVAEERYIQAVKTFARRPGCPPPGTVAASVVCPQPPVNPMHAELRSDLLLVKPVATREWLQFRDVFEVDGQPVRDRSERLTRLFLDPSSASANQIARILDESTRYNIGDIRRNINTPLFALQFLERLNQPRFEFRRTRNRVPEGVRAEPAAAGAFRTSVEVWAIEYQEKQPGTVIRTADFKDLPSRGRFWIEPDTGRVLISELVARNRTVQGTVDVSYQSEPLLGLLVPVEMRERYNDNHGARVEAIATYGRFRQFQVNVDEKFLVR
jgi:hypothetical protein